ncbi:glycosyltransferase family 2 protein [Sagittula sp. SSi028]|uniref:glycosyltransferase family 2 protein n=1 Tax=Sagittula sp. SSi028 TaxID=3400636 RepID=UPI003AF96769
MNARIALVICSVGRAEIVADLLPWIVRQTVAPSHIVFVVTKLEDLPVDEVQHLLPEAQILISEKGLPRQRNMGLDAVQAECEAVFFIDDDYFPAEDAIEGIGRALERFPDAAGFTGKLLADGIHTGGVSAEQAHVLIEDYEVAGGGPEKPVALAHQLVGLYGCNMAYRCSAIGAERFDQNLPLYAWQEDVDFAARLKGEKIRTDAFAGVHCGTSTGRETSGYLLGYSQVANPIYLLRKGSLPKGFALRMMWRNVLANHVKSFRPEPWIDRRGRARGNRQAFREVINGTVTPNRILELTR